MKIIDVLEFIRTILLFAHQMVNVTLQTDVFAMKNTMWSNANYIGAIIPYLMIKGACVILNGLIRSRGKELENRTSVYIESLVKNMSELKEREQVFAGLLHATRGIARHHPVHVINTLLSIDVPHSK